MLFADDEEKVRLDDLQVYFYKLFGKNVLAPISDRPTHIGHPGINVAH